MAAPAITASIRYSARGATKIYWLPSVASPSAVTRAELNAGTDLSPQVADAGGFNVSSEQIETPDLATRYTSTIPGSIAAEESSLTMYASRNGVDARTLMARDTVGFIGLLHGGDVAGYKCDIYPVTVSSVAKQIQVAGSEADTLVFSYAITAEPAENVSVPA
jgi:hypothetical protein